MTTSASPRRPLRLLSGVLASASLVVIPLMPSATAVAPAEAKAGTSVTLMNINDFHGRISSTAKGLACSITNQRTAFGQDSTVLLSAGDNLGASEFASYIQNDDPTIDYLNALGLKASALGNHEYDKGKDDLKDHIEARAKFPYLAANIQSSDPAYQPKAYAIVNAGDTKIAVIGADTQETPSLTSPAGVSGLTFTDPVAAVNKTVDELKKAKADGTVDYDLIVAEYHDGAETSPALGEKPKGGPSFEKIVSETSADVAAIFNGHTHQKYLFQAPVPGVQGATRPVVQTGSYGENLGVLTLVKGADGRWTADVDKSTLVPTKDVKDGEPCTTDATYQAAAKIADDAKKVGDEKAKQVIGSISSDVTTAYAPANASYVNGKWTSNGTAGKGDDRESSSTLSDTIADSMVWATQQDSYGGTRATIGVMNPGGVRADLLYKSKVAGVKDGDLTFGEANDVLPFVNNLATVSLTGAQFTELLNQQWQRDADGNVPTRAYLQLGLSKNVSYTYDASKKEGERITSVTIDGKPLKADAKYTIVAANFLTDGGDNFHALAKGSDRTDTGLLDRDAWIDYLKAHKDLTPSYDQRGIGVHVEGSGTEQSPYSLTVTGLESHSLGAPQITEVAATVAGKTVTAPYAVDPTTGRGTATLTLPTGLPAGPTPVTVTGVPDTGTSATFTVTMPAPEATEPSNPTDPADTCRDLPPGQAKKQQAGKAAASGKSHPVFCEHPGNPGGKGNNGKGKGNGAK